MTESGSTAVDIAAPEPPALDSRGADAGDLRFAAAFVVILAVLGAILGLVWAAWSPPGPRAYVLAPGVFLPDETEAFIAGDGRFLLITALAGAAAAVAAWCAVSRRGPLAVVALVAGGLAGAALTELVGHLTGGGAFTGKDRFIDQLPLSLHAQGLLFVEPALAALVYGVLVAFTARDDLGRPDPAAPQPSAQAREHAQHGGGYGDASGAAQQDDLPPQ